MREGGRGRDGGARHRAGGSGAGRGDGGGLALRLRRPEGASRDVAPPRGTAGGRHDPENPEEAHEDRRSAPRQHPAGRWATRPRRFSRAPALLLGGMPREGFRRARRVHPGRGEGGGSRVRRRTASLRERVPRPVGDAAREVRRGTGFGEARSVAAGAAAVQGRQALGEVRPVLAARRSRGGRSCATPR